MKKAFFLATAVSAFILLAPENAEARRVHTHTSYPDQQTEIFCKANPDQCETKINWGASVGGTLLGTAFLTGLRALIR